MLHKWRKYYYKIKIIHRASGREHEFGPRWLTAEPDRIAMEIRRREYLLFQEKAGRIVFLFPRLTFGQRCVHCWDRSVRGNTIGRATQQSCSSCFDTTFVGGYASPIVIYAQIDPTIEQTMRTDLEEQQFSVTTARTPAFPPIKSRDMLIEGENKRWRVESMTPTEKLRATIRQELKLRRYPMDDIKHKVPVNFDLLTEFSPVRSFIRPMSLQDEQPQAIPDAVENL